MRKIARNTLVAVLVVLINAGVQIRAVASDRSDCESHLLPSEVAQAYLGLFEHYCGKVSWLNCRDRIHQVLSESRFMNPFSGAETDSLSIKLDIAFESLRDRFDVEQWQAVQAGLGALRERLHVENQDREKKSAETAPIFDPRETDRRDMGLNIKSLAWHEAWGGLYLAGVRGEKLFLFPVVNGKTRMDWAQSQGDKPWLQMDSISWIHANDRHYLIANELFTNRQVNVFEFFKSGELRPVTLPEKLRSANGKFATSPVKIDGRDHIVATVKGEIVLIEPSEPEWAERTSTPFLGSWFFSDVKTLQTVQWRDQQYVVGISKGIFVYKVEQGLLRKLFENADSYGSRGDMTRLMGGSITVSGDHILFATPEESGKPRSRTKQLIVFDFDLRLEEMQSFRLPNVMVNENIWPSWAVKDGRTFLGLPAREASTSPTQSRLPLYNYFEWTGDNLIDAGQYRSEQGDPLFHAIQWFDIGSSLFSMFGSGTDLHFLQHLDRQIVTSKTLPIPILVSRIASTQYRGRGYVAIGNTEKNELLIFDWADRKRVESGER